MAKFSNVVRGTRAVKEIELPVYNTRCDLLPDLPELATQRAADKAERAAQPGAAETEASAPTKLGVRVLSGLENAEVLQKAREFAIKRGVENPREGEAIYDFGMSVYTVAIACVDIDSPPNAREPFFDGGVDQVLGEVDSDLIAWLMLRQQIWTDECSVSALKLSMPDAYAYIAKVTVDETDLSFTKMRPGLQWTLLRFLGRRWLNSPEAKLDFSLAFDMKGNDAPPATPTSQAS